MAIVIVLVFLPINEEEGCKEDGTEGTEGEDAPPQENREDG